MANINQRQDTRLYITIFRRLEETNSDEFHSVGIGRFKLTEVRAVEILPVV